MSINFRDLEPALLEPRMGARDDHFVELYDDDDALVASVRTFLSKGLEAGEVAVIIGTPAHRRAIERELGATIDLEGARRSGLFESLDAQDTLDAFTVDGLLDPVRFAEVIGGVLGRAAAGGRQVRVFGEMVALLIAAGDVAGAMALEDHWNELAASHRFRLFCAYPNHAFAPDDTASLTAVCNRHSHVLVAP